MISDIMTLREVADYLKVTKQTIYRMLNAKQIPSFKVRSDWRFRKDVIDKWIEQGTPEREGPGRLPLPLQGKQDKPDKPSSFHIKPPISKGLIYVGGNESRPACAGISQPKR